MSSAVDDVESKLIAAQGELTHLAERLQALVGFDESLASAGKGLGEAARAIADAAGALRGDAEALKATVVAVNQAVQALRAAAPQQLAEDAARTRQGLEQLRVDLDSKFKELRTETNSAISQTSEATKNIVDRAHAEQTAAMTSLQRSQEAVAAAVADATRTAKIASAAAIASALVAGILLVLHFVG